MKRDLPLIFLFMMLLQCLLAQNAPKDTLRKSPNGKNPKKASILSAILPGAGQVYNGKYWKLPILYGGGAALGYFIGVNNQQYEICRKSYLQVKAGEKDYFNGAYDAEQLARLREYWRRNRDLLIIVSGFTYLMNIADAAVDAHLSQFDVNDDLSLRVQPALMPANGEMAAGFTLRLEWKR
jgi:hypothetical protein